MAKSKTTKKAAANKRQKHDDEKLTEQVVALRDDKDMKWGDIAEKLKITPGKAQFLHLTANVKDGDRISTRGSDEQIGKRIVKARDQDLLSWGQIMARTGKGLGVVKRLYDEAGGTGVKNVASERAPEAPVKKTDKSKPATGKAKPAKKTAATGKTTTKGKGRSKKRGSRARRPSADA